jgi:PPP family 3-phenylpropionic acid transporter
MSLILPYFFAFTIYGVASPYLSVLIRGLGYSPTVVGLLLGLFEVAGIGGPFLLGHLSDRLGRSRPSLAIAFVLILLSLFPLLYFHSIFVTLISLIVMAVGLRSIIPLMDATATLTLSGAAPYGKVRSAGSASFVIMSLLLQVIPFMVPNTPVHIGFWIGLMTLFSLATLIVFPHTPKNRSRGPLTSGNRKTTYRWSPVFIVGLVMIGLGRLAMAPITSFFSLYVVEALHWNAVGLMWAISATSEIPFIFFSGPLIRRFGAPRLLAFSMVAISVRLALYALFPTPLGAVVGQTLHSLCFGLFHPAAVAFVATHVPPERRAVGMSLYLSLGVGLPTFLGSAVGGLVVDLGGYRLLFGSFITFALAGLALYGMIRHSLNAPAT